MVLSWLSVELLLAALAGGVVGAAMGALPALSLAGGAVVVGEAIDVAGASVPEATALGGDFLGAPGLTGSVGFGPVLGPHVAFAGGVAAAAYAGRHGNVDTDLPYHGAKDVRIPLGTAPDVLAAGGIFGVVGALIAGLSVHLSVPVDPIALSVVLTAFLHRIAFGYPLVGTVSGNPLDMSPFEAGRRRGSIGSPDADGGEGASGRRYVVEPWLPHQYEWPNVAVLGLGVGLGSGYLALVTGSAFLAFGLTAAALLFLALGFDRFPVAHHMALPSSIAALAVTGVGSTGALALAGAFGLLGAVLGELAQRLFYAHADTHFDPPMASILLTSLVLAALSATGVLDAGAVPYPPI